MKKDTNKLIENLLSEATKEVHHKAKTKMIRSTKGSQINRAAGRTSIRIAEEKNDPMYKRYVYFKAKYLELKEKLMKKYGRRGLRDAKKSLM